MASTTPSATTSSTAQKNVISHRPPGGLLDRLPRLLGTGGTGTLADLSETTPSSRGKSDLAVPITLPDRVGTTRVLLQDAQACMQKLAARVDDFGKHFQQGVLELQLSRSAIELGNEKAVAEIADVVRKCHTENIKVTESHQSSLDKINENLVRMNESFDNLTRLFQTHTTTYSTLSQTQAAHSAALQAIQDNISRISSTVLPLLPLIDALPARIDAAVALMQHSFSIQVSNSSIVKAELRESETKAIGDVVREVLKEYLTDKDNLNTLIGIGRGQLPANPRSPSRVYPQPTENTRSKKRKFVEEEMHPINTVAEHVPASALTIPKTPNPSLSDSKAPESQALQTSTHTQAHELESNADITASIRSPCNNPSSSKNSNLAPESPSPSSSQTHAFPSSTAINPTSSLKVEDTASETDRESTPSQERRQNAVNTMKRKNSIQALLAAARIETFNFELGSRKRSGSTISSGPLNGGSGFGRTKSISLARSIARDRSVTQQTGIALGGEEETDKRKGIKNERVDTTIPKTNAKKKTQEAVVRGPPKKKLKKSLPLNAFNPLPTSCTSKSRTLHTSSVRRQRDTLQRVGTGRQSGTLRAQSMAIDQNVRGNETLSRLRPRFTSVAPTGRTHQSTLSRTSNFPESGLASKLDDCRPTSVNSRIPFSSASITNISGSTKTNTHERDLDSKVLSHPSQSAHKIHKPSLLTHLFDSDTNRDAKCVDVHSLNVSSATVPDSPRRDADTNVQAETNSSEINARSKRFILIDDDPSALDEIDLWFDDFVLD